MAYENTYVNIQNSKPAETAFSDPNKFLSYITGEFERIPTKTKGVVTQDDLRSHMRSDSTSAQDKAADEIALAHFQQLKDLSRLPPVPFTHRVEKAETLSKGDLVKAADIRDGRTDAYANSEYLKDGLYIGLESIASIGSFIAAGVLYPSFAGTVAFGFAGLYLANEAVDTAVGMAKEPGRIEQKVRENKATLSNWDAFDKLP